MGQMIVYKVSVRKAEGTMRLGTPRRKAEDNIKTSLREFGVYVAG
jgi:hypothetical protein